MKQATPQKSCGTANSSSVAFIYAIKKGTAKDWFSPRVFLDEFCHQRMHDSHSLMYKKKIRGHNDQQ